MKPPYEPSGPGPRTSDPAVIAGWGPSDSRAFGVHEAVACGIVFVLGAAARVWRLNAESFWLDEITCWIDAQGPVSQLLRGLHPASQLLMKGSIALFGASNAALRLPGMVCGLGAIAVLWWALRRAFGSGAAFLGLALAAFSPYEIHYSRDANHYGLTMLLSAASFYFLVRFVLLPRVWTAVVLVLLQIAAWKTHPFNLALSASLGMVLAFWAIENRSRWMGAVRERMAGRGLLMFCALGVGVVVLVVIGAIAARRVILLFGDLSGGGAEQTEGYAVNFATYGRIAADLGGAFFDYRPGAVIAGIGVLLFFAVGVGSAYRRGRRDLALFGVLVLILPHLILAAIPFRHFFNTRYLAFQSPVLLGFAAVGMSAIAGAAARRSSRLARAAVPAAFLIAWGADVIPCDLRLLLRDREPYEPAAVALARDARPDDKVFCFPPWSELALRVSLERRGLPVPRLFTSAQLGTASLPTLYRLGYLAWMDAGHLYYYASYRRYDREYWPEAWHWVRRHFTAVFEEKSAYIEDYARKDYAVGVYRFDYSGRFVMPFVESRVAAAGTREGDGRVEWHCAPCALAQGRYAVELRQGEKLLDLEGWTVSVGGKESPLEMEAVSPGESSRFVVDIRDDITSVTLRAPSGAMETRATSPSLTLTFGPLRRKASTIAGWMAVDFGPFRYVASARRGNTVALVLAKGAWGEYVFDVPDATPRYIQITALARGSSLKAPMEMDGRPVGNLSYSGGSLGDQVFPLGSSPGRHRLRVFAGRERLKQALPDGPARGEPFLIITQVSVEVGEAPRDDRIDIPAPGTPARTLPREAARPW